MDKYTTDKMPDRALKWRAGLVVVWRMKGIKGIDMSDMMLKICRYFLKWAPFPWVSPHRFYSGVSTLKGIGFFYGADVLWNLN